MIEFLKVKMEKAVLKTLIYADIFDHPLKAWEIHKWLIGKKCDMTGVEKALQRLINKKQVVYKNGLFALSGREHLLKKTAELKFSQQNIASLKIFQSGIRLIPWVKLVGLCGDWRMKRTFRKDPVRLFIVTSKNKLGASKMLVEAILRGTEKICLGKIVEESELGYEEKNLYQAVAVLKMQPIWQRDHCYSKYLRENSWAFNFLPNWTTAA